MNLVYLIRRKSDGQYYRKEKVRYSKVERSKWTPEPVKAWATHDKKQIMSWYLCANYPSAQHEEAKEQVEIVTFQLVEIQP